MAKSVFESRLVHQETAVAPQSDGAVAASPDMAPDITGSEAQRLGCVTSTDADLSPVREGMVVVSDMISNERVVLVCHSVICDAFPWGH